ncbi:MAG: DUF389 domain-containing protein [Bryobacteraceae bacterium]
MIRHYLARALKIDRASQPKLYGQIYESAEIASAGYLLDLLFSAGIATLGLVLNSPAVVIGAMLISPLMGPILATGLAFAASDVYLGVKSTLNLIGSVVASVAFSAALVWILPFQSPTSEIMARTQPNLLDLGVAIFSGLAGSVVMARSLSGSAASALPGVAIAVALMPPLCAVGFGIGGGWNWYIIGGAGLLFLTNLVAIGGSAFLVFYLVGMDSPTVRASISEAEMRHATGNRLYRLLHDTAIGRLFGDVGQLRWRILMVIVTFGVLFVPLRSSLMQLRDETLSRAAAREAIQSLVPADHVLSQQVEILPDRLLQRLVTTTPVDKQQIAAAEMKLSQRTGKVASIQVRQVANEEELITLRDRLRPPPPPPPAPPSLKSLAGSVRPLVDEPLKGVWPSDSAKLTAYEVGFAKDAVVVRLTYEAPKSLDSAAEEAIRNALKRALDVGAIETVFDWQRTKKPAPVTRTKK